MKNSRQLWELVDKSQQLSEDIQAHLDAFADDGTVIPLDESVTIQTEGTRVRFGNVESFLDACIALMYRGKK